MKLLVIFCIVVVAGQCSVATTEVDPECFVTEFEQVDKAVANCRNIVLDSFYVPAGETLRLPLLNGTTLTFRGFISFEYQAWKGPLVVINATNALIQGKNAILDGDGRMYWDGQGEWGTVKPKFFTINLIDSVMRDIYVLNSPQHVANVVDSRNVELSGWIINNIEGAVEAVPTNKTGHNTDGFDFFNSTNIVLRDSQIYNQDDCIAIYYGANIFVDNVYCYGSSGLSISAGVNQNQNYDQNTVLNVTFQNCQLDKGWHAIHVRNHVDAGLGLIQNVTYRNITFNGPKNAGVLIQQNFKNLPPGDHDPVDPVGNIPIRDVLLENVVGTAAHGATPVYIKCADDACSNWEFRNVVVTGNKNNSCNFEPNDYHC